MPFSLLDCVNLRLHYLHLLLSSFIFCVNDVFNVISLQQVLTLLREHDKSHHLCDYYYYYYHYFYYIYYCYYFVTHNVNAVHLLYHSLPELVWWTG